MSDINLSSTDRVLKHEAADRTLHWFNLLAFITLALSGFAVYFHLEGLAAVFGGAALVGTIHAWAGAVFIAGPIIYLIFNSERFGFFADTVTRLRKDDWAWLGALGGYLGAKRDVPAQDKYNAGQKILGVLVIVAGVIMAATGLPMWLWRHSLSAGFINLCWTVHLWTAIGFVVAILGHVYLAAINPSSRHELSSMLVDGYCDAQLVAKANGKWFAELRCDAVPSAGTCAAEMREE